MADPIPLSAGDPVRLGGFELLGRIGTGGQGVVYLGRPVEPGGGPSRVAVKLLHARLLADAGARERFVRELALLQRVAGFCTAQMLAADMAGDRPYIVSEYVPGLSLRALVQEEGPRTGADLDRLAISSVTALSAIHRANVVHRDFKPQNVLMGPDGPRVIDFGIARAFDAGSTMTSQVVGTPAYMAPEQFTGRVGPGTDLFAWASTLLFAATGRDPFAGGALPAVMYRIMHETPDLGVLPAPLSDVAAACLAKDPKARPTSEDVLLWLLGERERHARLDTERFPGPTAPAPRPTAELTRNDPATVPGTDAPGTPSRPWPEQGASGPPPREQPPPVHDARPWNGKTHPGQPEPGTWPEQTRPHPGQAARPGQGEAQPGPSTRSGQTEAHPSHGAWPGHGEAQPGPGTWPGQTSPHPGQGAWSGGAEARPGQGARSGRAEAYPGQGAWPGHDEAQRGPSAWSGQGEAQSGPGTWPGQTSPHPGQGAWSGEVEPRPGQGARSGQAEAYPSQGAWSGHGEAQPGSGTWPEQTRPHPGQGAWPGEAEARPGQGARSGRAEAYPGQGAWPGHGEAQSGQADVRAGAGESWAGTARVVVRRGPALVAGLLLAALLAGLDVVALAVLIAVPSLSDGRRGWLLSVVASSFAVIAVVTLVAVILAWRGGRAAVWTVMAARVVRVAMWAAWGALVEIQPSALAGHAVLTAAVVLLLALGLTRSPR